VAAKKPTAKKAPARKVTAAKAAAPSRAAKAPKAGTLTPSPALAAIVGDGLTARTEVVKKLWDYIKAQGLQDARDKRTINADAKLQKVFGKPQVTMFELAGLIGPHLQ
jgi:DNA topoisomerase-3